MTEGNNQATIITGLYPQGLQARGDFIHPQAGFISSQSLVDWPTPLFQQHLFKY